MNDVEIFNRCKNIQDMLNDYLSDNHMPTVTEIMAKAGEVEAEGVLTSTHQLYLQQVIAHEYPDINNRIKAAGGSKQVLGILSVVERELISEMLENYLAAQSVTKEEFMAVR